MQRATKWQNRASWVKAALKRHVIACLAVWLWGTGINWGLPASESWAADAIAPRGVGLFAVVNWYWPGHVHRYPPLHQVLNTLLALPSIATAALSAWVQGRDPEAALIDVVPMTTIEVLARAVSFGMALGILELVGRIWERMVESSEHVHARRTVGTMARATVLVSAPLCYYAKVSTLDVPALFWCVFALYSLGRYKDAKCTEVEPLALALCAALTKDQAVFLLALPFAWVWVISPLRTLGVRGSCTALRTDKALQKRLLGLALATIFATGLWINPHGIVGHYLLLKGAASETWAQYPKSVVGYKHLIAEFVHFFATTSGVPLCLAALLGLGLAAVRGDRSWRLMPALALLSFFFGFIVSARRTEHRFLMPFTVLFMPYAALLVERIRVHDALKSAVVWTAALLVWLLPLRGAVSLDATLLTDARYRAEAFLRTLPASTKVEVVGGPKFLPRMPAQLVVTRVADDPLSERSHLPHIHDILGNLGDFSARDTDVLVLSTEFSRDNPMPRPDAPPAPFEVRAYTSEKSRWALYRLTSNETVFELAVQDTCHLPWPLRCEVIHGSTGGAVYVYKRAGSF